MCAAEPGLAISDGDAKFKRSAPDGERDRHLKSSPDPNWNIWKGVALPKNISPMHAGFWTLTNCIWRWLGRVRTE